MPSYLCLAEREFSRSAVRSRWGRTSGAARTRQTAVLKIYTLSSIILPREISRDFTIKYCIIMSLKQNMAKALLIMTKKPGIIQIDVDGLWVIFQHFGIGYNNSEDILYESALPRFLDLFDAYNIKVTLFVVGKDLNSPKKETILKKAVRLGHEIANHTMNHPEGFSFLTLAEKKREIEEAEKVIYDKLGVLTKGFRTPSNDVDTDVLKILEDRGYIYDSSILPTYYGPLLKKLKFSNLKISRNDHYLGKAIYGLAPLIPYHPDEKDIWKKGRMKILEVPITTIPWLRLPFHASFTYATYELGLGCLLFKLGYSLLSKTSLPLNFVFHTNELSDPVYEEKIKRQFGLNFPIETKQKICHYMLSSIVKNYEIISTLDYSKKICSPNN